MRRTAAGTILLLGGLAVGADTHMHASAVGLVAAD
jgi:hypothetical protein